LGHPCKFQRLSRLGSVTARRSSSERQPNFAALNRGCHATYVQQGDHHVGHWPTFLVSCALRPEMVYLIFLLDFLTMKSFSVHVCFVSYDFCIGDQIYTLMELSLADVVDAIQVLVSPLASDGEW